MRMLGLLALGAGVGYLFGTDSGRKLRGRAGAMMRDRYGQVKDWIDSRKDVAGLVRDRAEHGELPDTAMAHALEDAATA